MIYLDNSATTAPKESILTSFIEVNKRYYANPASLHVAGKEAEALLEKSREQILSIVESPDGEVIFTSGGTEANNIALIGIARAYRSRGNHIITTVIEHPSVLHAVEKLAKEGFEVDYLPVDEQGEISVEDLKSKIRKDTILVSIMHINNEIGTIQPIEQCAKVIKAQSRAIFHSDCVQSFGKLPITLTDYGPDAITVSAHKIHGLKGSGVLVTRKGIILEAINYGGGQEKGLRSGTVSVPDATALAKAMRLSVNNDNSQLYRHWRKQLVDKISLLPNIRILAKDAGGPHILSLAFPDIKGEVLVNFFQENNIIISTSSACSSKSSGAGHVIDAIGLEEKYKRGVIRISFGESTIGNDIIQFEMTLLRFLKLLKRGKKNEME